MNVGDRRGRLILVHRLIKGKGEFLCDCGNSKEIIIHNVEGGRTISCGCLNKERLRTHGLSGTKFYKTWENMKQRCRGNGESYKEYYLDRGLGYSKDWELFINFYNDMYSSYKEGLELDRKDNDKGYSKENCRWVTRSQNMRNVRGNKNTSSKYKGVCWDKSRGKWVAYISKGKLKMLGRYDIEEDAARAYNSAALELFGEYASLNKIKERLNEKGE